MFGFIQLIKKDKIVNVEVAKAKLNGHKNENVGIGLKPKILKLGDIDIFIGNILGFLMKNGLKMRKNMICF